MTIESADNILERLIARFQLALRADFRKENEGIRIILRPEGLIPSEGFHIDISVNWKTLKLEFILGDKAGQLLIVMGQADNEKRAVFSAVSEQVISEGGVITMSVNNQRINPIAYNDWPKNWQQFSLSLKSPYIETEADLAVDDRLEEYILRWTSIFLSMIAPLLPLEERTEKNEEQAYTESLPEGAKIKIIANRYERSHANREACISYYGSKCQACGFDFSETYGPIGEGYIEVHHIIPVSEIGKDYMVNPVKDLIPLCANCHAIVHRKTPPLSIKEIASILKQTTSAT